MIGEIRDKVQAIVPLPIFYVGSEVYSRSGGDNSMIPAILYSYHTGIPILSASLSRTSISETENTISLLNSYQKNKPPEKILTDKDFLIIRTKDSLMPDEKRLFNKIKDPFTRDSTTFGYLTKEKFLERLHTQNDFVLHSNVTRMDSSGVFYIVEAPQKPFIHTKMEEYGTVYILDSNQIRSGQYIVSFHYYHPGWRKVSGSVDLVVSKVNHREQIWKYLLPARMVSGVYKEYTVFEQSIQLDRNSKHEFFLKGSSPDLYTIKNFLIRPAGINVLQIHAADTLYNNFAR